MPEVSRFYGIVIRIFFGDHPPPHFHATRHQGELLESWERASRLEDPGKIDPLD